MRRLALLMFCVLLSVGSLSAQQISLQSMVPHTTSASYYSDPPKIVWWGGGFFDTEIIFNSAGLYRFTVAFNAATSSQNALMMPELDHLAIDHGPDTVSASDFVFSVPNSPFNYTNFIFTKYITAGSHLLGIGCLNCSNSIYAGVNLIQIDPIYLLPSEPIGFRDPTVQPFRSYSIWNTAIGSGALWSAPTDVDTIDIRHAGATINAAQWSIPVYIAGDADPLQTFTSVNGAYPFPPLTMKAPAGMVPSPPTSNGDHHLTIFDPGHRFMYNFFGCSTTPNGFNCSSEEQDDVCSDGSGTAGWGIGLIRTAEIQAGVISHMLRFALPTSLTKGGTSYLTGVAWPAVGADFCSPGCYSGHVLYGSTIGIPSSVDITTLGLTPSGLVLARALQDYGALQRDTGGSSGVILYAEQGAAISVPNQLLDMVHDLDSKIRPVLSVMRNQSPATINGGGILRQPPPPRIDPAICPNP